MGLHDEAVGQFLSTPSARRATAAVAAVFRSDVISIHALREEGDAFLLASRRRPLAFLSTPSARRATRAGSTSLVTHRLFLSTPSARRATVFG